jgi:hypothetical protein
VDEGDHVLTMFRFEKWAVDNKIRIARSHAYLPGTPHCDRGLTTFMHAARRTPTLKPHACASQGSPSNRAVMSPIYASSSS